MLESSSIYIRNRSDLEWNLWKHSTAQAEVMSRLCAIVVVRKKHSRTLQTKGIETAMYSDHCSCQAADKAKISCLSAPM